MSRGNVLLEAENFEAVNEEEVSQETKEKSQTEDGVYVKGMALPFGTPSRNGVQYEKESVKKSHEDLQGRTMLFNHKQDWVTGHILNTEITEDGMYFEGDINPNAEMPNGVPVAEAIERGDINSVSIQAFIEQLGEEADEEAVVQDMETEKVAVKDFLEISAVSIPGFPQAEALPEHLQQQGVEPVTEMVGTEDFEPENSEEDANTEAPEFDDMGECISYHMDEEDMEQDQAVAVCMDKMDREDLPEAIKQKLAEQENDTEDDTTMSNNEEESEEDSAESENQNQEQVSESNFEEFVASHMEGADVADVTEALADYNFTGLDQGEVASLLAQEFDLDTGTVMDALGQLEDMEGEAMDDEEDEEDEDEEEESTGSEEETEQEETEKEKSREELKEKVENLEKRLETLLSEDEGKSRQQSPSKEESESTIQRKPSFKGSIKR